MEQAIKNKITINRVKSAFIAASIFIGIFLIATYSNMSNTESESRSVKSALDVLLRLENILIDIRAIETSQQGYINTGDQKFFDYYNDALKHITNDTTVLAALQLNDSTKLEERGKLLSLLNKRITNSKKNIEVKRISILDSTASVSEFPILTDPMDDIVAMIKAIESKDKLLLEQSNYIRQKYAKRTTWQFFSLGLLFYFMLYYGYKTIVKDFRKLEENEKTLKFNASLIQNISDPIITTDDKNNISNWNSFAEEIYGYKEDEVIGKNMFTLLQIAPNTAIGFKDKVLITDKDYWKGETTHQHKNGKLILVDVSRSSIKNILGEVIGTVCVVRDITQRKSMEMQLQQFNATLQQQVKEKVTELNHVFERITDAFIALDNNWNYTYVNTKAEELHGKSAEALVGKNIWEIFPDVKNEPLYDALHKAKATQEPQKLQLYYSTSDKWFEDLIYPSENGISLYYHDITTRKKTEISLQKIHEKLSYHIKNTPMGVIEFDNNMNILQWSKLAESIFEWTEAEVINQEFDSYQLVNTNDRESIKTAIRELASSRTLNNNVLHILNKNKSGKLIYCEWYNSVLRDHTGKTIGIMSLVQDVTGKKQAELALQEAEQKFRNLVEQSMVGVYIVQDEKLVYTNPRFAQIFGYEVNEFTETFSLQNIVHKDDIEKVLTHIRSRIAGKYKTVNYEFKGIHKNGGVLYLEVFGTLTLYQSKPAIIGTLINVTERKKSTELLESSELALKISNERFSLVAKATNDAVWDWDMQTDKIWGNQSFYEALNLDKNKDFTFDNFKNAIHEDDLSNVLENLKLALQQRETSITEEFRIKTTGSNEYLTFNNKAYIIYNSENRAFRMLGAMQDITEKKESEIKILREKELSDSIINSLPGIFYINNKQGKFYRWNKNFEKVSGYNADEIQHMHPLQLFNNAQQEFVKAKTRNVFINGEDNLEAQFVSKDGQETPYYFTGMLINYQGEICLMGVGIDISERKKADEALKLSENKYRILFNQNPMPMLMISIPERNFLDVNNAAISHYGYSKEAFLQMNIGDLQTFADTNSLVEDAIKYPTGINNIGIWQHRKKDGTIIQVNIIAHDIFYEGKNAKLLLANDLTEKIIAEENLKKSHKQLRELAVYLENIRESERTHMAREIHDELGQQLTGLKMDISWLNRKLGLADAEIKNKLEDTLSLIDKTVITVRRIATELRPSILDDLGLVAAMEWQSEEFQKRAEIKTHFYCNVSNVAVKPEIATGVFRIYQESLTNVLRHAHATETISSLTISDETLELQITDNGNGFNLADIENKKTLGLLGMRERTVLMGGKYEISGEPGVGTSVRISVPLA
jgi:PAS domain S-box-containing protein